MNADLIASAQALIDAIEGIQDWGGTHVGDCIADLERAIYAPSVSPPETTTRQEEVEGDSQPKQP